MERGLHGALMARRAAAEDLFLHYQNEGRAKKL